ncbi:MAG: DNA primase TraC (plasmid) [Chroococcopsis gigantea SAG 12.99]|jgi:antirestriction protein ArdC|nr:DNA primase TraC [Chroococcopsis gigantea SAG 12.99]
MSKPEPIDKFQLITDKLITLIDRGVKPWSKPWHSTPYQNLLSGHQYTGMNPILCAIDTILYGYEQPFFVSFCQAKEIGWSIKKGAKSTWIRWGGTNVKETEDPDTGEKSKQFFSAFKFHNVFNVACIDDSKSDVKISAHISQIKLMAVGNNSARIESAETFIDRHAPKTHFGGDVACYLPEKDTIAMPKFECFTSPATYYATYIHELVHWTGHPTRCDRPLANKFGSHAYAFEEMIAEIGAAMVCNELGVNCDIEHHASYLDGWLSVLKQDKKAFFEAAKKATTAAQFLMGSTSEN